MGFCTVINCMDGRTQLPVIQHLQKKFSVAYVDSITEAGPSRVLAEHDKPEMINEILTKLKISIEKHKSVGLGLVAHHDCAGNPTTKDNQLAHLKKSIQFLQQKYPNLPIIPLWVNESFQVEELELAHGG